MRILMISLDKGVLDPSSRVAARMKQYGQTDSYIILVPDTNRHDLKLSPTVRVIATGGNKRQQFMRLLQLGHRLILSEKLELVTTQDPFFTGLVGLRLKNMAGLPLEVQAHGDFYSSDYYRNGSLMNRFRYELGKYVLRRADRVRVVGQRIRQSLVKLGIPAERIEVRSVPVDRAGLVGYQPRQDVRAEFSNFEKIFLFVGRFEAVKNLPWLIDIFAESLRRSGRNDVLILIGEGSQKDELKRNVAERGLEKNIKFKGWTSHPFDYYTAADALLFPSLSEGYGLVVMEASLLGCRVIMTDVGVANYEVKAGPKIVIVSVNNREGWIQALLSM